MGLDFVLTLGLSKLFDCHLWCRVNEKTRLSVSSFTNVISIIRMNNSFNNDNMIVNTNNYYYREVWKRINNRKKNITYYL